MPTIEELMQQKREVEEQIADKRKTEIEDVIFRINLSIEHYGITAKDLKFPGVDVEEVPAKPRKYGAVSPKYRHPETGATWTGRGKAPLWIACAESRDEFLIVA